MMDNKTKTIAARFSGIVKGEVGLFIILILLGAIFSLTSDHFLDAKNLLNITRQVSVVLIISIGMLCVVLTGEIDLSVGSNAALAGVACAYTLLKTGSQAAAIGAALCIGILVGVFNGYLTVYQKVPSFIVTLASMGIVRGFVLIWTQGKSMSGLPQSFSLWGAKYIGGVLPVSTSLALVLVALGFFFIHKTRHGVYLKAIGANPEAAVLSAIPLKRYKMAAFMTTGLMCAIGGIITTSKLLSAQPTACDGMEMDVLSAVILGGAALSGGVGTITGTLIGALTIGVINNGMNLLNVSPFFQDVVKGSIILAAVLIKRKKTE